MTQHSQNGEGVERPVDVIEQLRRLYRGLEMSAGIMRDPGRTGGWSGATRTADAFARYAATAQSLHALLSAQATNVAHQSLAREPATADVGRLNEAYKAVEAWPENRGDPITVGSDGFMDLLKLRNIVGEMLPALSRAAPSSGQQDVGREAVRAVTAEMRRFMPNACGDWADKIDAAMLKEKARKVAFYDEPGHDIRPGETLPDRDRRIYQQGRHDALNDEPEAFI